MYKLRLMAIIFLTMLFLPSCSLLKPNDSGGEGVSNNKYQKGSDDEVSDAMFEDILDAVKNKDADTIKGMFSIKALAEAKDMDSAMEYLFHLFDGDVVSWERGALIADESIRYGKSSYQIKVWYTVYTEKGKYEFLLINYRRNTIDPDLKGLYTLHGIDDADENALLGTWQEMEVPGVYMTDR